MPPRVNFPPKTLEDFSDYQVALCFAEPEDPTKIPMYPKSKVYSSQQTEFSLEEIRAFRYINRDVSNCNVAVMQKQQIVGARNPELMVCFEFSPLFVISVI